MPLEVSTFIFYPILYPLNSAIGFVWDYYHGNLKVLQDCLRSRVTDGFYAANTP